MNVSKLKFSDKALREMIAAYPKEVELTEAVNQLMEARKHEEVAYDEFLKMADLFDKTLYGKEFREAIEYTVNAEGQLVSPDLDQALVVAFNAMNSQKGINAITNASELKTEKNLIEYAFECGGQFVKDGVETIKNTTDQITTFLQNTAENIVQDAKTAKRTADYAASVLVTSTVASIAKFATKVENAVAKKIDAGKALLNNAIFWIKDFTLNVKTNTQAALKDLQASACDLLAKGHEFYVDCNRYDYEMEGKFMDHVTQLRSAMLRTSAAVNEFTTETKQKFDEQVINKRFSTEITNPHMLAEFYREIRLHPEKSDDENLKTAQTTLEHYKVVALDGLVKEETKHEPSAFVTAISDIIGKNQDKFKTEFMDRRGAKMFEHQKEAMFLKEDAKDLRQEAQDLRDSLTKEDDEPILE